METVVGIFTSRSAAENAVERLQAMGMRPEQINMLTPGAEAAELEAVPTTDAEPPGVAKVLGGVVGGVTGASAGLWGAAVASVLVPGVGPVMAMGLAAAALLGVGGAVAGVAAGDALEKTLSVGLPKDELFIYEDALRRGRTVLIVMSDEDEQADEARDVLAQSGAESLDAAHEHWWLGVRDAEEESYLAQGGDFAQSEALYRRGFEEALRADSAGKSDDEALKDLEARYPDAYREEAFRRGYARGRVYQANLRSQQRGL
jgi:hypothetical protein